MKARLAIVALGAAAPGPAMAHAGTSLLPATWSFEPWALMPIALAAGLFAVGSRRLRARSGAGRAELARRAAIFWSGLFVLAAAVVSPLHALGARSFTAHMLEHELIMLVAAPLLVWARPLPILIWAFPGGGRRMLGRLALASPVAATWRTISDPAVATALQAAALWLWHLPGLFDLALSGEGWHALQHLSFFASALIFWSAMLGRRSAWTAALCLFATSMISGALGAFMALSPSPWYAAYAQLRLAAFGLTPAEDQQLAGVLMWVPGGLVHAGAALAILAPHLRSARRGADA